MRSGAGSALPSATCTCPIAKRVPAPGWHEPQVFARLAVLVVALESLEGRMLCTPWQLAQFATVWDPDFAAKPWNEESKLITRSLGRPNLRFSRTSSWHVPQVSRT